jgi:cytochrome c
MNSLEVNKACAAVLVAGVAFMFFTVLSGDLVSPTHLAKPAIKIEGANAAAEAGGPPAEEPIAALLASADPKAGMADTAKLGCVACHSFNEGGKAGIGPNLYGVVGAAHGHMPGYEYSAALKGKQGPWTYDELNEWLKKPAAYAPGTKMTYAGITDPKVRADVIDYLHTLAATPVALPAAPPPTKGASAAPASQDIDTLLASADEKAGQADTMKLGCIACHSFNEGGKAGLGPNLYGVVGGPHAHMPGYEYSSALKAKTGPWTYDELNAWLTKPAAYAPGTKMTYAGITDPKQRADVIDYLRSLSHDPIPLPPAK